MAARSADIPDLAELDGALANALDGTLERYADRPDRITLHPNDVDDVSLMASWLSADADAFVGLEARR